MKKIIVLSLSLLFTVFALSATNQCIIVAYDGVSGIPVGANYYHADAGGAWDEDKNRNPSAYPNSKGYGATEMIGLIQFLNENNGSVSNITLNGTITVSIYCPNGFYLTSQSNPNYKRPFEIILAPSANWSKEGSKKVSAESPTQSFTVNKTIAHVHFDVVIRLPGTTDDTTKECTVNNVVYPLIEEDDYSSVVTFEVKYYPSGSSTATITKSLTVPFSGYYSPSTKDTSAHNGDKYANISMNILMNSEAYNIDMKNKCNVWIPIGELYFNMMFGKKLQSSVTKNAAIFFSSSENPLDENAEIFTMVHDDVGVDMPLSSLNSKTFTLRVVSEADGSYRTFDGTTWFDDSLSDTEMDEKYIYFNNDDVKTDYMYDYYTTEGSKAEQVRSYYRYSGRIEIMLSDNDVTMYEGRYTETVYVHIMVYQ